jgi:hypothetical protein
MTQMMVCSRGRGCQPVTLPEPPLAFRIEQLLHRAGGKRLTLRQICAHLKLEAGHEREAWQNVCRVAFELAKLEERHTISFAAPDAHWIDPPRVDETTGARR